MYYEFLILTVCAAFTNALSNQICPCDTEQDIKENAEVLLFLQKLSQEVSDDTFSAVAGELYQFDCSRCDEKDRTKRKADPAPEEKKVAPETPYVLAEEKKTEEKSTDETVLSEQKRSIRFKSYICPQGYIRLAHFCVPEDEIEGTADWTQ